MAELNEVLNETRNNMPEIEKIEKEVTPGNVEANNNLGIGNNLERETNTPQIDGRQNENSSLGNNFNVLTNDSKNEDTRNIIDDRNNDRNNDRNDSRGDTLKEEARQKLDDARESSLSQEKANSVRQLERQEANNNSFSNFHANRDEDKGFSLSIEKEGDRFIIDKDSVTKLQLQIDDKGTSHTEKVKIDPKELSKQEQRDISSLQKEISKENDRFPDKNEYTLSEKFANDVRSSVDNSLERYNSVDEKTQEIVNNYRSAPEEAKAETLKGLDDSKKTEVLEISKDVDRATAIKNEALNRISDAKKPQNTSIEIEKGKGCAEERLFNQAKEYYNALYKSREAETRNQNTPHNPSLEKNLEKAHRTLNEKENHLYNSSALKDISSERFEQIKDQAKQDVRIKNIDKNKNVKNIKNVELPSQKEINKEKTTPEVEKDKEKTTPEVEKDKEKATPEVEKDKEKATPEVEKNKEKATPDVEKDKEKATPDVEKDKEKASPKIEKEKEKEKEKASLEVEKEKKTDKFKDLSSLKDENKKAINNYNKLTDEQRSSVDKLRDIKDRERNTYLKEKGIKGKDKTAILNATKALDKAKQDKQLKEKDIKKFNDKMKDIRKENPSLASCVDLKGKNLYLSRQIKDIQKQKEMSQQKLKNAKTEKARERIAKTIQNRQERITKLNKKIKENKKEINKLSRDIKEDKNRINALAEEKYNALIDKRDLSSLNRLNGHSIVDKGLDRTIPQLKSRSEDLRSFVNKNPSKQEKIIRTEMGKSDKFTKAREDMRNNEKLAKIIYKKQDGKPINRDINKLSKEEQEKYNMISKAINKNTNSLVKMENARDELSGKIERLKSNMSKPALDAAKQFSKINSLEKQYDKLSSAKKEERQKEFQDKMDKIEKDIDKLNLSKEEKNNACVLARDNEVLKETNKFLLNEAKEDVKNEAILKNDLKEKDVEVTIDAININSEIIDKFNECKEVIMEKFKDVFSKNNAEFASTKAAETAREKVQKTPKEEPEKTTTDKSKDKDDVKNEDKKGKQPTWVIKIDTSTMGGKVAYAMTFAQVFVASYISQKFGAKGDLNFDIKLPESLKNEELNGIKIGKLIFEIPKNAQKEAREKIREEKEIKKEKNNKVENILDGIKSKMRDMGEIKDKVSKKAYTAISNAKDSIWSHATEDVRNITSKMSSLYERTTGKIDSIKRDIDENRLSRKSEREISKYNKKLEKNNQIINNVNERFEKGEKIGFIDRLQYENAHRYLEQEALSRLAAYKATNATELEYQKELTHQLESTTLSEEERSEIKEVRAELDKLTSAREADIININNYLEARDKEIESAAERDKPYQPRHQAETKFDKFKSKFDRESVDRRSSKVAQTVSIEKEPVTKINLGVRSPFPETNISEIFWNDKYFSIN